MSPECKAVWSLDFINMSFNPNFIAKYRKRRATITLSLQRSLLPGTQQLASEEKIAKREKKRIKEEIKDLRDTNKMMMQLVKENKDKLRELMYGRLVGEVKEEKKKVLTYTCPCPRDECVGFLSESLQCGMCEKYACKKCRVALESKDDKDHECDPDTVETVKFISKSTRQCPKCHTPIHKIEGCDQMYCTQCHTPFSWTTGAIETGRIHNPHYYEYQRKVNNGVAPRVAGDVRCGGLPGFHELNAKSRSVGCGATTHDMVLDSHRIVTHILAVEIPRLTRDDHETKHTQLRVKFLLNKIDKVKWLSEIKRLMKKGEKEKEYCDVLRMFTTTIGDILRNFVTSDTDAKALTQLAQLHPLRKYANEAARRIGNRYKNAYPMITTNWVYKANGERHILLTKHTYL
jgi:hypothetical protein